MKLSMRLTMDDMIRALRIRAQAVADEKAEDAERRQGRAQEAGEARDERRA